MILEPKKEGWWWQLCQQCCLSEILKLKLCWNCPTNPKFLWPHLSWSSHTCPCCKILDSMEFHQAVYLALLLLIRFVFLVWGNMLNSDFFCNIFCKHLAQYRTCTIANSGSHNMAHICRLCIFLFRCILFHQSLACWLDKLLVPQYILHSLHMLQSYWFGTEHRLP